MVTTPLSGWFNCAGERGTGLAIAISVAQKLAAHRDIVLIMPTGHELGFLGAERFVETFDEPVAGVLHLGSCVADHGAHGPDGYMRAVTNLDRTGFQVASDALSKERIELEAARDPADPACWIGESELWAPKRLPMVSIAGTSPNFHTPADTVENATSRELLERMDACVLNAAQALIGHNRN